MVVDVAAAAGGDFAIDRSDGGVCSACYEVPAEGETVVEGVVSTVRCPLLLTRISLLMLGLSLRYDCLFDLESPQYALISPQTRTPWW